MPERKSEAQEYGAIKSYSPACAQAAVCNPDRTVRIQHACLWGPNPHCLLLSSRKAQAQLQQWESCLLGLIKKELLGSRCSTSNTPPLHLLAVEMCTVHSDGGAGGGGGGGGRHFYIITNIRWVIPPVWSTPQRPHFLICKYHEMHSSGDATICFGNVTSLSPTHFKHMITLLLSDLSFYFIFVFLKEIVNTFRDASVPASIFDLKPNTIEGIVIGEEKSKKFHVTISFVVLFLKMISYDGYCKHWVYADSLWMWMDLFMKKVSVSKVGLLHSTINC